MPEQEVRATLSQVAQRVEAARDNPGQAAAEVRQGVAQLYEKARASGASNSTKFSATERGTLGHL